MKKTRLFKNAHILAASLALCASLFAAVSCSDISQPEEPAKNEVQAEKPVLKIKIEDPARTVFPSLDLSELSNFSLGVTPVDGDELKLLGEYGTLADLQKASIELDENDIDKEYIFKLSAILKTESEVKNFSSTITTKLKAGENPLTFRFIVEDLGEGKGSLDFTLDYSADTKNASKVYMGAFVIETPGDSVKKASGFVNISGNKATVNVSELPAGTYRINIKLTASLESNAATTSSSTTTEQTVATPFVSSSSSPLVRGSRITPIIMAEWQEIIHIATGYTSKATRKLTSLNDVYQLTYVLNYEGEEVNRTVTVTPSSNIAWPDEREGYTFAGWYTDEALTKPFEISKITEDTTVYAKWIDNKDKNSATAETILDKISQIFPSNTSAKKPATIKVYGPVYERLFVNISEALHSNSDAYIALDFSETTGITELPKGAFYECQSLVGLTIPASVEKINASAFQDTPNLKEILVAEDNENFKAIDGVLYSKDGSILIAYPAGKAAESYTTPESVTRIRALAFSGQQKTPVFNITNNVMVIEGQAFYECNGIKSINFDDIESQWYEYGLSPDDEPGYTPEYDEIIENGTPCYSIETFVENWKHNSRLSNSYARKTNEKFTDYTAEAERAVLADTESFDLTDGGYNILMLDGTSEYKWVKLSTVPGTLYKVFICDYDSCTAFKNVHMDTEKFYDGYFRLLTNTGKELLLNPCDFAHSAQRPVVTSFTFVAESITTYFRLENYDKGKFFAFRVTTPGPMKPAVDVTFGDMPDDYDYLIFHYDSDDLIYCNYDNESFEQYIFGHNCDFGENSQVFAYVDGELLPDLSVKFDREADKGLHILTIEVVIKGKRYSYSRQVNVSNKTWG